MQNNIKIDENNNYIKDINPILKYGNINNDIIKFYFQVNQLKNLYRQGWLKGILAEEKQYKCESIADHCFGLGILAISIIEKYKLKYNVEKCLKFCLLHELGEIYAGDFIPKDNVTSDEKHELEKNAILKVIEDMNFDNDFLQIWEEYEKRESEEAIFIKELDGLEFLMQAAVYETDVACYKYSLSKIKTPVLVEIVNELINITKGKMAPTEKMRISRVLEELSKSNFRSKFKLKVEEKEYIKEKGLETIRKHAYDFIEKRLAPAIIENDGKQTPMKGHPVFIAQHATATCCRECLYRWHKIPTGRELTKNEVTYIVEIIMSWIEKN